MARRGPEDLRLGMRGHSYAHVALRLCRSCRDWRVSAGFVVASLGDSLRQRQSAKFIIKQLRKQTVSILVVYFNCFALGSWLSADDARWIFSVEALGAGSLQCHFFSKAWGAISLFCSTRFLKTDFSKTCFRFFFDHGFIFFQFFFEIQAFSVFGDLLRSADHGDLL